MAPTATAPVLSRRVLNRTLLHRQRLLERGAWDVAGTIDHLVGMQSQVPKAPFVGLWTRIVGFDPADLDRLMLERRYVRGSLMRTTLHLVSADDALALRPLFAPVLERSFVAQRAFREGVSGLDADELREVGRDILEAEPIGTGELGQRLLARFPGRDASALAHAIRFWLPLVQVTPRGTWASRAAPRFTTYRAWLGRPPADHGDAAALLRRYLAAFGPASVADMRVWSWLTGLRSVVDSMADELRTFRDESGRVLYDVPDAPILRGDEPAPIRFLPEYDNVLLSHDDRTRVVERWLIDPVFTRGSVLVDGFVGAAWSVRSARRSVRLVVETFGTLPPAARVALDEEADALLRFVAPGAETRELDVTPVE
jgi:hypothetical protein